MNQDNPTLQTSEIQQISPLLFNKVFNDANLSGEEKARLLHDASRACRLVFFGRYDRASAEIQAAMLRDYCEAMLCLATKYDSVVVTDDTEGGDKQ